MRSARWRFILVVFLGTVCSLGSGCGRDGGNRPGALRVVVTYSILGDLVKNVAGEQAEVVTLVGPDGDTHTFEPTPKDGAAIADADVIVENGVGYETWLDKLYASSRSRARRVVVTSGLELRQGECSCCSAGKTRPPRHEDDPHVWHDVQNAVHMVQVIRDALVEADPNNHARYRANAAVYLARLNALDRWVQEALEALPKERRKLVTSHHTFGYFADRYGFEIVGTALRSVSTEAADPSAGDFATLIESVKASKVPAVFPENIHNPKLMERLARDAGVKLAPPLCTDALGKPGTPGDTYEKMVRHNVTTILGALKP